MFQLKMLRDEDRRAVKGKRIVGSDSYNPDSKEFHFRLVDNHGDECLVVYKGVKPANYEQATEVVAIGKYTNDRFKADHILIKCPSKYQGQ